MCSTVADSDPEVTGGGGGGVVLLALPAFLSSVISSFLPKIGGREGPSSRSSFATSEKSQTLL